MITARQYMEFIIEHKIQYLNFDFPLMLGDNDCTGARAVLNFHVLQQLKQVFVLLAQFTLVVLHLQYSPFLSTQLVEDYCDTLPSFCGEAFASSVVFRNYSFTRCDKDLALWVILFGRLSYRQLLILRVGYNTEHRVGAATGAVLQGLKICDGMQRKLNKQGTECISR